MFGSESDSRYLWVALAAMASDDGRRSPSDGVIGTCLSALAFGYLRGAGRSRKVAGAPVELLAGGLLACGAVSGSGVRPLLLGLAQGALGTHFAALGAAHGDRERRRNIAPHAKSSANGSAHTDAELATMIREALASE